MKREMCFTFLGTGSKDDTPALSPMLSREQRFRYVKMPSLWPCYNYYKSQVFQRNFYVTLCKHKYMRVKSPFFIRVLWWYIVYVRRPKDNYTDTCWSTINGWIFPLSFFPLFLPPLDLLYVTVRQPGADQTFTVPYNRNCAWFMRRTSRFLNSRHCSWNNNFIPKNQQYSYYIYIYITLLLLLFVVRFLCHCATLSSSGFFYPHKRWAQFMILNNTDYSVYFHWFEINVEYF